MRNKDSVKQISIEYNDSNTLKFYISKKVEKQPLKQQKKKPSASSFYSQCRIGYSQILQIFVLIQEYISRVYAHVAIDFWRFVCLFHYFSV